MVIDAMRQLRDYFRTFRTNRLLKAKPKTETYHKTAIAHLAGKAEAKVSLGTTAADSGNGDSGGDDEFGKF